VIIESDRACCILGEQWKGNAKGCKDVIYLTVGTGIGAGILIDGDILHARTILPAQLDGWH
jgi:glucokinase